MKLLRLPLIALGIALAPIARGDSITGQVVDSLGTPVPGVDIDVVNLGSGGDPPLSNDVTDATGAFDIVLPAGIYLVLFKPPAPPVTTHLVLEVDNVIVIGVTNMGVLALEPGVALSGRVLNQASAPVSNVDIDLLDLTTGSRLTLVGDKTNTFGQFAIAAPAGPVELRFDTAPVVGPLLAPTKLVLSLTGDTDVGDVQLEPGFLIQADVQRPNGSPIDNVDVDVIDTSTNADLYTPGDNTNQNGHVDFVVPAGTYDIEFCPQFADLLVGLTLSNVVVASDQSLGIVQLQPGVVLSGHVQSGQGASLENVDLDVRVSATQASITTCADNTNANGNYAVIIPTGTFDVSFTPPGTLCAGDLTVPAVVVTGNTTLDATLPDCLGTSYCGPAVVNSSGQSAVMGASGSAVVADNDLELIATNLPNGQFGYFVTSEAQGFVQNPGGSQGNLCLGSPLFRLIPPVLNSGGNGSFSYVLDLTNVQQVGAIQPGETWNYQAWFRDLNPTATSNFTDGFSIAFQ